MISPPLVGNCEVISSCVLGLSSRIILALISWSDDCWPPKTEYRGRCVMVSRDAIDTVRSISRSRTFEVKDPLSGDSLQGGGECWPDAESMKYGQTSSVLSLYKCSTQEEEDLVNWWAGQLFHSRQLPLLIVMLLVEQI